MKQYKKIIFIIIYSFILIITTMLLCKQYIIKTMTVEDITPTEDGETITVQVNGEYITHYYEY